LFLKNGVAKAGTVMKKPGALNMRAGPFGIDSPETIEGKGLY
jgi:hypothetical protein